MICCGTQDFQLVESSANDSKGGLRNFLASLLLSWECERHWASLQAILNQRGDLNDEQIARFKAVGYDNQQLLEIILGIAQKTISNYTNKLANTPLDDQFK